MQQKVGRLKKVQICSDARYFFFSNFALKYKKVHLEKLFEPFCTPGFPFNAQRLFYDIQLLSYQVDYKQMIVFATLVSDCKRL